MAGAGWHDFVPGEVLTAANVQDYLQDQAVMKFASAAARAAALPSPSQGMMSFLNDTGVVETYYAAWNATTNPGGKTAGAGWYATDRNDGLVNIVPPTVAVSGGSATANSLGLVTFTGVTSLSLNNVFSSTYKSYKVIVNYSVSVNNQLVWLRYRTTNDDTSANYTFAGFSSDLAGLGNWFGTAQTRFPLIYGSNVNSSATAHIDLTNPNDALATSAAIHCTSFTNSPYGAGHFGVHNTTTQFTGMTLIVDSGNMTGTVQVFGYNN